MDKNDYKIFAAAWRNALTIYGKDADTDVIATVFGTLQGYPLDEVLAAINEHLVDPNDGRFQPKPADIVRNIQRHANADAGQAFDRVLRQLNPYVTPVFDDERVAGAVCAVGGWQALCRITNSEIPTTRARFIEAFNDNARPRQGLLKGLIQDDNEGRIRSLKPELLERFPHPTKEIVTKSKEISHG